MTTTTKHAESCKRVFARYDIHCPRCRELMEGMGARKGWNDTKRRMEAEQIRAIREHDCRKSGCGPVCTAFDW